MKRGPLSLPGLTLQAVSERVSETKTNSTKALLLRRSALLNLLFVLRRQTRAPDLTLRSEVSTSGPESKLEVKVGGKQAAMATSFRESNFQLQTPNSQLPTLHCTHFPLQCVCWHVNSDMRYTHETLSLDRCR